MLTGKDNDWILFQTMDCLVFERIWDLFTYFQRISSTDIISSSTCSRSPTRLSCFMRNPIFNTQMLEEGRKWLGMKGERSLASVLACIRALGRANQVRRERTPRTPRQKLSYYWKMEAIIDFRSWTWPGSGNEMQLQMWLGCAAQDASTNWWSCTLRERRTGWRSPWVTKGEARSWQWSPRSIIIIR